MTGSGRTRRAPADWNPQRAITVYFPAMADLCRAVQPEVLAIQASLDRDEARSLDTACVRQALRELCRVDDPAVSRRYRGRSAQARTR